MSLYIPKMSDTPAITIPGLADNFNLLADSRIVEYGSNENGEYARWENGLQICLMVGIKINYISPTRFGQNLSLPGAFADQSYAVVAQISEIAGYTGQTGLIVGSNSSNNIAVNIYGEGFNSTMEARVNVMAIGRWK